MRLVEHHYKLLDLANWIVPLGWMFAAMQFHLPAWMVLGGFLIGFLAVNFRLDRFEGEPANELPFRRHPVYARPSFWLLLGLPAYLVYLVFQSRWLLWYLLIAGMIGFAVAVLLRRRYQRAS